MLATISGHYSCYLHRITQWVFSMINTTCPLCYFIQWLCIIHLPSIISFTVGNENTGRARTFALKANAMPIDKMGIFFDTFATFFLLWHWEVIPFNKFQPTWILMCTLASKLVLISGLPFMETNCLRWRPMPQIHPSMGNWHTPLKSDIHLVRGVCQLHTLVIGQWESRNSG